MNGSKMEEVVIKGVGGGGVKELMLYEVSWGGVNFKRIKGVNRVF